MEMFEWIVVIFVLCFVLYAFACMVMSADPPPVVTVVAGVFVSVFIGGVVGPTLYDMTVPDEYYLPCEIVVSNDTYTYFGTADSDSQEIFAVETGNHIWPDDVPYLLYMDGKGTKDVKDDEVLAVWRTE